MRSADGCLVPHVHQLLTRALAQPTQMYVILSSSWARYPFLWRAARSFLLGYCRGYPSVYDPALVGAGVFGVDLDMLVLLREDVALLVDVLSAHLDSEGS